MSIEPSTAHSSASDRSPQEFHYWQALSRPWAQALRTALRWILGFDPAPPESVVRTFASMYYDADPLAEAFVDEVYLQLGLDQGRAMLDQALARGVASIPDPPPSLLRLFDDIDHDPPWLDLQEVERGAAAFRRYGPAVFRFAGAITLLAYSENSVAKPLALTGTYASSSARHRFLETVAFWIAVSEPGGLAPAAPGRASALRVRIMHVFVRDRLLRHPEWDAAAYGVPISQADALLTLMGGSYVPGLAMRALGYWPSDEEIEAMMHFWRYVGHLMGVRPRWFPASMKDAAQLMFMTVVKSAHRAGDDERTLCQGYARAFEPSTPAPERNLLDRLRDHVEHRVHLGYTRLFLPTHRYWRNDLPFAAPFVLAPLAPAPLRLMTELLRRRFDTIDDLLDRRARRRRDRWFARHMGDRSAEYRPVQHMTR